MNEVEQIKQYPIVAGWEELSEQERRQQLENIQQNLEDIVSGQELMASPPAVKEYWADGLYARELTMPTGFVIMGKIHKHRTMTTVTKGSAVVFTDKGVELIEAPTSFVGHAGVKRLGFILEEMTWISYHPTNETTTEGVEEEHIVNSYEDL